MRKNGRRGPGPVFTAAMVVCLLVFLISGGMFLRYYFRSAKERDANRALAAQVREAREAAASGADSGVHIVMDDGSGTAETGNPWIGREILPQYAALWQQNRDLAGWLRIEGTGIDYPVMYTPGEPEYYLHRGFDQESASSGSLFIGPGSIPWENHVIVYGHHMKDGSMFGKLDSYQKEAYAAEHPVIRFDTLVAEGEYQVLAAFYTQVDDGSDPDAFRYYEYMDLEEPGRFEEYVENVRAVSLYDTGVEAEYGDSVLTLSTCSYHTKDGRFVVVAVRKD